MSSAAEWDRAAVDFDEAADHGLRDPTCRAAWRDLLLGVLPPTPARVADLGCGTGTISRLLADAGHLVTGLDFSPAMLRRATQKAPGTSFLVADASDPPVAPECFDVVFSRHVLWAMPDPEAALRRWVRLLVPSGRLVLVEGRWHTGAGVTRETCSGWVRALRREAVVHRLGDPVLWGGATGDDRYLLVSER